MIFFFFFILNDPKLLNGCVYLSIS